MTARCTPIESAPDGWRTCGSRRTHRHGRDLTAGLRRAGAQPRPRTRRPDRACPRPSRPTRKSSPSGAFPLGSGIDFTSTTTSMMPEDSGRPNRRPQPVAVPGPGRFPPSSASGSMNGASRGHPIFAWGYAKFGPRMDGAARPTIAATPVSATGRTCRGRRRHRTESPALPGGRVRGPRHGTRPIHVPPPRGGDGRRSCRSAEASHRGGVAGRGGIGRHRGDVARSVLRDRRRGLAEPRRCGSGPGGRLLFFEHVRADPTTRAEAGPVRAPVGLVRRRLPSEPRLRSARSGLRVRVQEVERFDEPGAMLAKPARPRVGAEALIASIA